MDIDLSLLRTLEREKEISFDVLVEAIEQALLQAYHKTPGAQSRARVVLDRKTGHVNVLVREVDEEGNASEEYDDTPDGFGRIAATTARQIMLQRLRDAQDDITFGEFSGKEGDILSGVIQQGRNPDDVMVDLGKLEAIIPLGERVPGEKYEHGTRIKALVVSVRKGMRGPQITLSRTHPNLVKKLFALEVPEIADGVVEIRAAARVLGQAQRLLSTVLQGFYQSHQATAAAVQVNNIHIVRGMLGKPGCGLLQMNGQPTAQNTRECGADGDLPAFRNWSNDKHVEDLNDQGLTDQKDSDAAVPAAAYHAVTLTDLAGNTQTLSGEWTNVGGLAWHPSGEIWFTAARDGAPKSLWAVDASGRTRAVAQIAGTMTLRDISPDGRVLASRDTALLEMEAVVDGQPSRNLSWLDWSRVADVSTDGRRVLFDESGVAAGAEYLVYVRDLDGQKIADPERVGARNLL